MGSLAPINLLRLLWDWYIDHLWNYERGSWVDSSAKSFRIIAWLAITPFLLFIMLDVASYIIARTLGVIDDTKASTSDLPLYDAPSATGDPPITSTNTTTAAASTEADGSSSDDGATSSLPPDVVKPAALRLADEGDSPSATDAFVDGNLRLSGVGVFSPAVSRASSPLTGRTVLPGAAGRGRQTEASEGEEGESEWGDSEDTGGGSRLGREASWGSLSMDSSFTIIDGDSEMEDTGGVGLRRRMNHDESLTMPTS